MSACLLIHSADDNARISAPGAWPDSTRVPFQRARICRIGDVVTLCDDRHDINNKFVRVMSDMSLASQTADIDYLAGFRCSEQVVTPNDEVYMCYYVAGHRHKVYLRTRESHPRKIGTWHAQSDMIMSSPGGGVFLALYYNNTIAKLDEPAVVTHALPEQMRAWYIFMRDNTTAAVCADAQDVHLVDFRQPGIALSNVGSNVEMGAFCTENIVVAITGHMKESMFDLRGAGERSHGHIYTRSLDGSYAANVRVV